MELKLRCARAKVCIANRINRTFMELKYVT
jgi:hypothetical protein